MLAEQRRDKILELIRENGSVRVFNLSKIFDVSEPTIRHDLLTLENNGEINRVHGGAYLKNFSDQVRTLSLQHMENIELKHKIGKKAAEFVKPNTSIILDSGSTVTELAKQLINTKDLRVITNSLNIALMLGAEPGIEVHVTGGEFKAPTLSLTGDKAATFFNNMNVDQLFLAAAGVTLAAGLTYPGFSDLPVKQAMIETAQKVYLLVDSTKMNRPAFAALNVLDRIDYMITDSGISDDQLKQFESLGMKVIIAQ